MLFPSPICATQYFSYLIIIIHNTTLASFSYFANSKMCTWNNKNTETRMEIAYSYNYIIKKFDNAYILLLTKVTT